MIAPEKGGNGLIGGMDRTVMATVYVNPSSGNPNAVATSSCALILSDPLNTFPFNGQNVNIGSTSRNNKNVIHNTLCEVYNFQSENEEMYFRFLNGTNDKDRVFVYPNPVREHISIGGIVDQTLIEVFSIDGKKFKSLNKSVDKLDVSDLETGMYFLKLKSPKSENTIKFIKQ